MFKRRSFQSTARLLCENRPEFLRKDGTLVVRRAATLMGMNQETLKRILDGESASPKAETAERMCRYLRVSYEQLTGIKPIPWIDQSENPDKDRGIQEITDIYLSGDPDLKRELVEFARFRAGIHRSKSKT